jgi:hypothetical protein
VAGEVEGAAFEGGADAGGETAHHYFIDNVDGGYNSGRLYLCLLADLSGPTRHLGANKGYSLKNKCFSIKYY